MIVPAKWNIVILKQYKIRKRVSPNTNRYAFAFQKFEKAAALGPGKEDSGEK